MSTITINNARVAKHVGERGAFQIVETYNGDWTRYWTIWFEGDAPAIDSIVNVHGEYNSKIRSYEAKNGDTKQAVDRSINNPTWVVEQGAADVTVEETDDETPF